LEANVTREFTTEEPEGRVFEQRPDAGTEVPRGETVTLVVSRGPPMATVPSLVGLDETQAIELLDRRGLKWEVKEVFSDAPVDQVVRQNPKAGAEVVEGSSVTLRVSKGAEPATVPDVIGQSQAEAEAELEANGFEVEVETVASDEPEGIVVDQSPNAGDEVPSGSTVTIEVSEGPQTTTVPNVVGELQEDAEQELQEAGFAVRVRNEPTTDENADGRVIDQNPSGGVQTEPGSEITIIVGEFIPEEAIED
ncbi:MAG: PASTA domain-containing protein, partial [Actinobacteria bacterium]|nr:PASTA domain-containing protein [Actinomycetota bacterium]